MLDLYQEKRTSTKTTHNGRGHGKHTHALEAARSDQTAEAENRNRETLLPEWLRSGDAHRHKLT